MEPITPPEVQLRNLTPHTLSIRTRAGEIIRFQKPGTAVQVDRQRVGVGTLHVEGQEVPLVAVQDAAVLNLPPRCDGVVLIVSRVAAHAIRALHPERDDIVVPGPADRVTEDGKVQVARHLPEGKWVNDGLIPVGSL